MPYEALAVHLLTGALASGPAFKKAVKIEPIANTQVYNIVCHVLSLDPAPNNGTSPLPDMFA